MSALMNQLCSIDLFNSLIYSGGVKDMYALRVEKKNMMCDDRARVVPLKVLVVMGVVVAVPGLF